MAPLGLGDYSLPVKPVDEYENQLITGVQVFPVFCSGFENLFDKCAPLACHSLCNIISICHSCLHVAKILPIILRRRNSIRLRSYVADCLMEQQALFRICKHIIPWQPTYLTESHWHLDQSSAIPAARSRILFATSN